MKKFIIFALVAFIISAGCSAQEGSNMIYLPPLTNSNATRSVISAFGGLDHRLVISEGNFYNENNLTSDEFPVLATCKPHGTYKNAQSQITGIIVKDKLCYTAGQYFYIGDERIDMQLKSDNHQLVSMGAYVIIHPEMKYINTIKTDDGDYEWGNMYNEFVRKAHFSDDDCYCPTFYIYPTDESGTPPTEYGAADDAEENVENPKVGDLGIFKNILKKYTEIDSYVFEWVEVTDIYTAVSCEGINEAGFHVGECVYLSGMFDHYEVEYGGINETYQTIAAIKSHNHGDYADGVLLFHVNPVRIFSSSAPTVQEVRITGVFPVMDYITESGNRLWGCRHGKNQDGQFVNEIYASELGNFKNFYAKQDTAADPYYLSLGSDSDFTGAVTHQGNPIFFKDNVIHRVVGTLPENYSLQTTECTGVKKGSYASLSSVNETVFYHGKDGIYAYDGSMPTLVSSSLGNGVFSNAVGCGHKAKYYVNMTDENGAPATYVYDTKKGIWHKQDEGVAVTGFASLGDELYYSVGNEIKTMFGSGTTDGGKVMWYAETGLIGTDSPDTKYLAKLTLRMALTLGATVLISVEYDSIPEWIPVATISGTSLSSFTLPIRLDRCDHLRLRFDGVGDCHIYSIAKTIEKGGEL